nr:hypothetical protein [Nocardia ninae]
MKVFTPRFAIGRQRPVRVKSGNTTVFMDDIMPMASVCAAVVLFGQLRDYFGCDSEVHADDGSAFSCSRQWAGVEGVDRVFELAASESVRKQLDLMSALAGEAGGSQRVRR